jgi:hypothetical protein
VFETKTAGGTYRLRAPPLVRVRGRPDSQGSTDTER